MSNFLATLGENFKTIFSSPLTLITLIGCAILLIAFIKFKSLKFNSKLIANRTSYCFSIYLRHDKDLFPT